MMDGELWASAERMLGQDQDLAFVLTTGVDAGLPAFVVESFTAHEAVNELFEVQLNLFSKWEDIDLHALMDTQATLAILSKYDEPRYLTGIITDCGRGGSGFSRTAYQLILRPPLARLAHVSDGRIWQNKSVVDVASEVLAANTITDVDWQLHESYTPREYLTQMPGERSLDFIKRILNEVGIFWYFDHQKDKCITVFTDASQGTPFLKHAATIPYNNTPGGQSRASSIQRFTQFERLRSSTMEYNDYWFKNPNSTYSEDRSRHENNGSADHYKRYAYPGRYKDPSEIGKPFVKTSINAERVDATTGEGQTNNIHLCPGWHMAIGEHPDKQVNTSHFLLSVSHSGTQPAALEEDATRRLGRGRARRHGDDL